MKMKPANPKLLTGRRALMLAVTISTLAAIDRAEAKCDPVSPVHDKTVTCTGATDGQNGNGTIGYGTKTDSGNTINVLSGASVTGTVEGVLLQNGTINNDGLIQATGDSDSAIGATATVTVNNKSSGTIRANGAGRNRAIGADQDADVTNFGADVLFPVLVRDAEALGIYAALGVPSGVVAALKGPRVDIINAINLGRPIPIADGNTGDVITLDAAIDSSFPNGRRLGGGSAPNRHQVNVNSVLISLIVAGNPAAGLAKGTEVNDKNFLDRFPFLAPAHQGLLQGHGGVNVPTVPNIPVP